MASKVKCTCGWSWDKSDSSKKDMYICHECGRDNSNNIPKAQSGNIVPSETEADKAKKVAKKVVGTTGIGLVLDQFPGVETVYDAYNVIDAYKEGDPMKIIPNFMGALLPGVSGKAFEAITDEYLPKTPQKEKDKMKAVLKGKKATVAEMRKAQESIDWSEGFKKLYNDLGDVGNGIKNNIDDVVTPLMGLKNGGWLDNYGKEDNYNDSQVSAPEGFQGDGYSNVGRNSSPAWGGQFQGGGNISAYKEQDYLDRGWDIISNPLTSFGYVARNEEIPDYLDRGIKSGQIKRNELENTLDLVNPIYYLNSAGRGAKDLITGDVKGFIGEAFNFIPTLKRTQGVGKLAKNSNKLKTFINTIGDVDAFAHATTGKDLISEGKESQKIKKKQMGGVMPGAVGHMYARHGSPSKGPRRNQTDVTDASAQNGKEMQYYQQGLDWKPKTISQDGSVIKDDRGQWDHPGEITEIGSNDITMKGVPYDVLGISDTGDTKLMKPGKNYKFKGKKVTEYPMAKNGLRQEQKGLQNLDNLTNFTNYNTKQPGGWLDTL